MILIKLLLQKYEVLINYKNFLNFKHLIDKLFNYNNVLSTGENGNLNTFGSRKIFLKKLHVN